MDRRAFIGHAPQAGIRSGAHALERALHFRVVPPVADHAPLVAMGEKQPAEVRVAQANRLLEDRLEYRLNVRRRSGNHAQDIGRGRLPFQRFLRLVEQAHVLDRDDRLVGEGAQQRHLLVGQRARQVAHHADRTDGRIASQHRHDRHRARAAAEEIADARQQRALGVCRGIRNVDHPAIEDGERVHVLTREPEWKARRPGCPALGIEVGDCREPHLVAVGQHHGDGGIREQIQAALHDGFEDRLRVGGRTADGLENF